MRSGQPVLSAKDVDAASPQLSRSDERPYRMNRKLSPDEQVELAALYQAGASMLELARKYRIHRQTVARHLKREGVELRGQLKRTPELIEQATNLYAKGHSTTEVAKQLGVEASTIGRALKQAGVKLRSQPPIAGANHVTSESTLPDSPSPARRSRAHG